MKKLAKLQRGHVDRHAFRMSDAEFLRAIGVRTDGYEDEIGTTTDLPLPSPILDVRLDSIALQRPDKRPERPMCQHQTPGMPSSRTGMTPEHWVLLILGIVLGIALALGR